MPSRGTDRDRFPELFDQTSVDPRSRTRKVEMQVLVIGMMRTGTKSIKAGLEQIGFHHVYHMTSAMKNPKDCDMWAQAFDAKFHGKGQMLTRKEWDQLLGDCDACIDVPTAAFMPELIEAYPNAKVIVSMRDPDKWYASLMATVGKRAINLRLILLGICDRFFLARFNPFARSMMTGMYGEDLKDAEHVKKRYLDFYDEVRRLVPEHKRLEYHLGDGWGPLCNFLGKDAPKTEFPFINESKEYGERITLMEKHAVGRILRNVAPVAGVIVLASTYYFGLLSRR
ncbi:hypothetical protein MMC26_007531 [Xylographa opegraphella]|nr:hypothetical protein [Xylographa opegraphella]